MQTRNITVGVSPKVSIPAVVLAGFGLAVAVVGILLGDDTLRTVGLTAIGAGVAGGFVGYAAPAGHVLANQEAEALVVSEASDDLLSPAAAARIAREPAGPGTPGSGEGAA